MLNVSGVDGFVLISSLEKGIMLNKTGRSILVRGFLNPLGFHPSLRREYWLKTGKEQTMQGMVTYLQLQTREGEVTIMLHSVSNQIWQVKIYLRLVTPREIMVKEAFDEENLSLASGTVFYEKNKNWKCELYSERKLISGKNNPYYTVWAKRTFSTHYEKVVRQYSWAVPTEEAILTIKQFCPQGIVEIGAGGGYWAYVLRSYGVDILAFDINLSGPENVWGHQQSWIDILPGGVEKVSDYSDRALMLCWPPFKDPMADQALSLYRGSTLIYIGEGDRRDHPQGYGVNADDAFFDQLKQEWYLVKRIKLPNWLDLGGVLSIFRRKN